MGTSGPAFDEAFFSRLDDAAALGPLFDYLPDVFLFVKDARHRFTMVNAAVWRMHACRSAADMLGKTDHDFHPPLLARQYVEEDRRVMAAGVPLPEQVWLVPGADRVPRWYLSTKMPVRDRAEAVIGVAGVMRPYDRAGRVPDDYRRVTPAIEHVLAHYGGDLSMADLARRVHLSVSQLQREFQRLFGVSPRDYVFQVRLQAARRLLDSTTEPLGQIAAQCGFYDQSHFVKRFKAATGLRPLEYRRRFSGETSSSSRPRR
jgi:AraC-like DNA-binding protein